MMGFPWFVLPWEQLAFGQESLHPSTEPPSPMHPWRRDQKQHRDNQQSLNLEKSTRSSAYRKWFYDERGRNWGSCPNRISDQSQSKPDNLQWNLSETIIESRLSSLRGEHRPS